VRIYGVDFTSRPTKRKPLTVASCTLDRDVLTLDQLHVADNFEDFETWLRLSDKPWCAGFDMPFGLPRELIEHLGWPLHWPDMVQHASSHSREDLRNLFKAFCDTRPVGQKFAHRRTDGPAGSSPSMKWVNPPVAWMFLEGAPRLLASGVHVPGLHDGDRSRIALEAYPGLLARRIIGRVSYKSDESKKQTSERRAAREQMIHGCVRAAMGIRVLLTDDQRHALIEDGSADLLDSVLCALQAAWGWQRRHEQFGIPTGADRLEGWIVSA
jgi:hypothetical protein